MSYKLKTLVVFDTNSLRSTQDGEAAFSFFAFGPSFQVVEEFILEKKLTEDIHIAIPNWASEELKDQKHRQYKTDEELTEGEELSNRQQMRAKWTELEAIVGNPNRIRKIAEDLVYDFEQLFLSQTIKDLMRGKRHNVKHFGMIFFLLLFLIIIATNLTAMKNIFRLNCYI